MSFTNDDLDALNTAIASGELTVEFNGRRATYRSIDELIRARNLVQSDIRSNSASTSVASDGKRRGSFGVKFSTGRGF